MIIGVLGAGQLARMLALAGIPMGLEFVVLDPAERPCAAAVARHIRADYDDTTALRTLADQADTVTFEFENVPATALAYLRKLRRTPHKARGLQTLQDRLTEKTLFSRLGIPTPAYQAVDSHEALVEALGRIGLPAVLKTRRFGYDGKGQYVLKAPTDAARAWREVGASPCLLERWVPFDREAALVAVRDLAGACVFYTLTQTCHREGILRWAAALRDARLQAMAQDYIGRVLAAVDHVGALAFEFFELDGQLLANEVAPRVHNSGHWTIEAAETSQFENHVRAVAGLPLGSTDSRGTFAMVNYIGGVPDARDVLRIPAAHHHDYGKAARPGRKVGHATVATPCVATALSSLERLLALIGEDALPRDARVAPLRDSMPDGAPVA